MNDIYSARGNCCPPHTAEPPSPLRAAPEVDAALAAQGVSVERFNLAQQSAVFANDDQVRGVLQAKGPKGLPIVMVNGEVRSSGVYPTRVDLAAWTGVVGKISLGKPIVLTQTTRSGCC